MKYTGFCWEQKATGLCKEIIGKGNGRRYSVKRNLLNNLLARLGLSHSQELNIEGFRHIQVQYKPTIWEEKI